MSIVPSQIKLALEGLNDKELALELLRRALTYGWSPEDTRAAEHLTRVRCEWDGMRIH